jgi:hypothetical protein
MRSQGCKHDALLKSRLSACRMSVSASAGGVAAVSLLNIPLSDAIWLRKHDTLLDLNVRSVKRYTQRQRQHPVFVVTVTSEEGRQDVADVHEAQHITVCDHWRRQYAVFRKDLPHAAKTLMS